MLDLFQVCFHEKPAAAAEELVFLESWVHSEETRLFWGRALSAFGFVEWTLGGVDTEQGAGLWSSHDHRCSLRLRWGVRALCG